MEDPRLGVQSELLPPAYATVTATPDPSHVCDLHRSSWQRQILDPLGEARDQTHDLMVPSWIRLCCATTGTPIFPIFILFFRATPMACGGSRARGLVGAVAAGLHHSHSNARSEPLL